MRSSERWKKTLGGGEALGTRRRELGKLQWRAAVRCAWSRGERAREREREGAHGVEARMANALALSTDGGGGRGVGEPRMLSMRHCWPDTIGRARRGRVRARGRGGGRGAGRPSWFRRLGRLVGAGPPVNSPPFPLFIYFFQKAWDFLSFYKSFQGLE